jgi:hypothetical protein
VFRNRQATAERCIKEETYGIVLVLQTLNVHTMIREEVGVGVGMCEMPIVSNASFRIAGTRRLLWFMDAPTDPKYPFCVQPHISRF